MFLTTIIRASPRMRRSACRPRRASIATARPDEIENLLAAWQQQYADPGQHPQINHVLFSLWG
jgi:hypothetical protein